MSNCIIVENLFVTNKGWGVGVVKVVGVVVVVVVGVKVVVWWLWWLWWWWLCVCVGGKEYATF